MRTFDWQLLPYFLAIARAGSLRAAAAQTNASYGTVNRAIQALEASYGVRLFHRSKRGFSLSEYGEVLLPVAEEAEKTIIAARKSVEGKDKSESGSIRFSLPPTLAYDVVAPIIGSFHRLYPAISIDVHLTSDIMSIPNDQTDISLRAAMEVTDDVIARKLFRLKLGVYASKRYLSEVFPKAGANGQGLTWIGYETPSQTEHALFPLAERRHLVNDGHMRARLMNQDCGMSFMPTLFEAANPDLARVPGTELVEGPWLWILLHSDLQKTVRVRRFVDLLTREMMTLAKV